MVVEEQSSSYRCFPETERQLSEPLKLKTYLKLKDCVHWMAPSVRLPFLSRQPVVAGEGPIGMWSSWTESAYYVVSFSVGGDARHGCGRSVLTAAVLGVLKISGQESIFS
jgi:hypothetical protein